MSPPQLPGSGQLHQGVSCLVGRGVEPLMVSPLSKNRKPRNIVQNLLAHAFCKSPEPVGASMFEGGAGTPRSTAALRVAPKGA